MFRPLTLSLFGYLLLTGCTREQPVASSEHVDTSHGRYEWKATTYPAGTKIASVVRGVNDVELASLQRDAQEAPVFIAKYGAGVSPNEELPYKLDAAFTGWMKSDDPKKEVDSRVIRVVGAALGFYCIDKLGMHWAITEDAQGIDTALVRSEPETRSFPFSSIRYRVEDKKTDFIYGLYLSLEKTIRDAGHIPPNQSLEPMARSGTPRAAHEPRQLSPWLTIKR